MPYCTMHWHNNKYRWWPKPVNTLCIILMNISTRSDSTALFVFSYSAVTSTMKAHHSSEIKLCKAPFRQLLRARSYANRLALQRGRQRHHRPCQHPKKEKNGRRLCLTNTPGVQSQAFFSFGLSKGGNGGTYTVAALHGDSEDVY